jgi:hypothetical protein
MHDIYCIFTYFKKFKSTVPSNYDDISIVLPAMLLFFSQALIVWSQREMRVPSLFSQRLIWEEIVDKDKQRAVFKRHLRMSPESFNKLLSYIQPALKIDERMAWLRGGPILPKI